MGCSCQPACTCACTRLQGRVRVHGVRSSTYMRMCFTVEHFCMPFAMPRVFPASACVKITTSSCTQIVKPSFSLRVMSLLRLEFVQLGVVEVPAALKCRGGAPQSNPCLTCFCVGAPIVKFPCPL